MKHMRQRPEYADELGQLLAKIFRAWALTPVEYCGVLGIPLGEYDISRSLNLWSNPEVLTRALKILRIYEILHCTNTASPDLADKWPTTPSNVFDGRRPVDLLMSAEDFDKVVRHIEASIV